MQSISSSLRRASQPFSASSLLRLSSIHSDVAKYRFFSGNSGIRLGFFGTRDGVTVPHALKFQNFIHYESQKNSEAGRSSGIPDSKRESTEENNSQTSQQNSPWSQRNSGRMDFERNIVHNNRSQPFQKFINSESQNNSQAGRFSGIPDSMSGSTGKNNSQTFQQDGRWSWTNRMPMDFDRNTTQSGRSQQFQNFTHSGSRNNSQAGMSPGFSDVMRRLVQNDQSRWRNGRSMEFVKDVLEKNPPQPFRNYQVENCDVVSIFIGRNNTKIHLTDSKGQGKAYVSAGCLPEMKSGAKLSRYAAEATSEYMGRKARELGVKSVVVKVNGLSYFKKKRLAIMSFREGFTGSRGGYHPIVHIEDTTQLAHNGCRLKKKRRI